MPATPVSSICCAGAPRCLPPTTPKSVRSSPPSRPRWRASTARGSTASRRPSPRDRRPGKSVGAWMRSRMYWPRAVTTTRSTMPGKVGTRSARTSARSTRAMSNSPTRARAPSATAIWGSCGARATTWHPSSSARSLRASTTSYDRSMRRCTATCARAWCASMARRRSRKTARFRPIYSATCGRRSGAICTGTSSPSRARGSSTSRPRWSSRSTTRSAW